nr:MAG TPA: hypothetical protein [Caudoviricetes sp.]
MKKCHSVTCYFYTLVNQTDVLLIVPHKRERGGS